MELFLYLSNWSQNNLLSVFIARVCWFWGFFSPCKFWRLYRFYNEIKRNTKILLDYITLGYKILLYYLYNWMCNHKKEQPSARKGELICHCIYVYLISKPEGIICQKLVTIWNIQICQNICCFKPIMVLTFHLKSFIAILHFTRWYFMVCQITI